MVISIQRNENRGSKSIKEAEEEEKTRRKWTHGVRWREVHVDGVRERTDRQRREAVIDGDILRVLVEMNV